jgi:hypothetical protein
MLSVSFSLETMSLLSLITMGLMTVPLKAILAVGLDVQLALGCRRFHLVFLIDCVQEELMQQFVLLDAKYREVV